MIDVRNGRKGFLIKFTWEGVLILLISVYCTCIDFFVYISHHNTMPTMFLRVLLAYLPVFTLGHLFMVHFSSCCWDWLSLTCSYFMRLFLIIGWFPLIEKNKDVYITPVKEVKATGTKSTQQKTNRGNMDCLTWQLFSFGIQWNTLFP